jgi:hypothetical protein
VFAWRSRLRDRLRVAAGSDGVRLTEIVWWEFLRARKRWKSDSGDCLPNRLANKYSERICESDRGKMRKCKVFG